MTHQELSVRGGWCVCPPKRGRGWKERGAQVPNAVLSSPVHACPRDVNGGSKKNKDRGKNPGRTRESRSLNGVPTHTEEVLRHRRRTARGIMVHSHRKPVHLWKSVVHRKFILLGPEKLENRTSADVQKSNPLYWVGRWSANAKWRVGWRLPRQNPSKAWSYR